MDVAEPRDGEYNTGKAGVPVDTEFSTGYRQTHGDLSCAIVLRVGVRRIGKPDKAKHSEAMQCSIKFTQNGKPTSDDAERWCGLWYIV
jgi:hypothetical protein